MQIDFLLPNKHFSLKNIIRKTEHRLITLENKKEADRRRIIQYYNNIHRMREVKHKIPGRESVINMAIRNVELRESNEYSQKRAKFNNSHDLAYKFHNYSEDILSKLSKSNDCLLHSVSLSNPQERYLQFSLEVNIIG
jgi:hypothetical protein